MTRLTVERRVVDLLLGAAVLFAGVWRDLWRDEPPDFLLPAASWLVLTLHVASAAALVALRRGRPYACAGILAVLAVWVPGYAALVAPYSVARYGPHLGRTLLWCGALGAGWLVGADLWAAGDPVSGILSVAAASATGLYLHGRDEALAQVARQQARDAVAEERRQVAADLHDAVTHWVSLMVLQSGAMAVRTTDPEARDELTTLRSHGVRAMGELHEMVAVLTDPAAADATVTADRAPPAPRTPHRSVEDVVTDAAAAGQEVSLRHSGPALPPDDPRANVLTRVTREALANARRHAPGASCAVHLASHAGTVRLLVRNAPPADADPAGHRPSRGSGVGLPNLRRVISELDGTLAARRTPEGGFEVDVTLPARHAQGGPP